jgi:cytochrome c-type biogenesis protein CcmH/NrfG
MVGKDAPEKALLVDRDFVEALKVHLRSNPKDHDALVALGLFMLSRGEADKALECFNRVSQAEPKYPGIWRFKAKAFDALGDKVAAEECRLRGSDPRS